MDIMGIYQRHKLLVVGGGLVVLFLLIRRFSQSVAPTGGTAPLPGINPDGNPTGPPDPGPSPITVDPGSVDGNPGTGPGTIYGDPGSATTGPTNDAAAATIAGAAGAISPNVLDNFGTPGSPLDALAQSYVRGGSDFWNRQGTPPPTLPGSAWSVVSGRQQSALKAQRAAAGLPPALPASAFAKPAARQVSARRAQIAAASLPATPVTAAPAQQTRADEHIDYLLPLPWQPPTVVHHGRSNYS